MRKCDPRCIQKVFHQEKKNGGIYLRSKCRNYSAYSFLSLAFTNNEFTKVVNERLVKNV